MNATAGIGDPYFYEWTVGLEKIISLMLPDKKLQSVTLQASTAGSLDDVVCEYSDSIEYIQVKHTRIDEKLGFGYLVSTKSNPVSLLNKIARSWNQLRDGDKNVQAILLTNRRLVDNATSITRTDSKIQVPSFREFWDWFEKTIHRCSSLSELFEQTPEEWISVVQVIIKEVDVFDGDIELLMDFLHNFSLKHEYPNTTKLDENILEKLMNIFSIPKESGVELYQKLFFSLKEWASSTRQKEEITVEDVYSKLAAFEQQYPEFRLLPPEPFFESRKDLVNRVEKVCNEGQMRALYIYGKPGIGKTSLINFLAQKLDSIIDLRYYAYIPISPESVSVNLDSDNTISEENLWGSLLNQLRGLFVGKLYEHNVPVKNSFVSVAKMREHVLRLASEYGTINGKNTVIVIDGIDHAARSGKQENFLNSFVPPEYVPDNVVFIICGQPAEDYPNYPAWLNKQNKLIQSFEIEGITKQDIKSLLVKINPKLEEIDLYAEVIHDTSGGNTLSAIFSAYESRNTSDLDELILLLEQKQLNSNITQYYDQIWKSRLMCSEKGKKIGSNIIAGLFVIAKEKVHIDDFSGIFDDFTLTQIEWEDILRSYSPLIVEENSHYFLYHNDVRVYLESQIQNEKKVIKNIASNLGDYYLKSDNKVQMRHTDIFRLLDLSDRSKEKVDIFTVDYLKEAFGIGQNLQELIKQLQEVCEVFNQNFDSDKLIDLSIVTMVLNQYVKVFERYDIKQDSNADGYYVSEFQKINLNRIEISDLVAALNDIEELHLLGLDERVIRTFKKWFSNTKVILSVAFSNTANANNGKVKKGPVSTVVEKIGYFSRLYSIDIDHSFLSEDTGFSRAYFWGSVDGIVEKDDITEFLSIITQYQDQSVGELGPLLDFLFENRKISWINELLDHTDSNSDFDRLSKINLAFFESVVRGSIGNTDICEFIDSENCATYFLKDSEDIVFVLCKLVYIAGASGSNEIKTIMVDRLVSIYHLINRDSRGKEYLENLLSVFFDLGQLTLRSDDLDLVKIVEFLEISWQVARTPFLFKGTNKSSKFIEWYLAFFASNTSDTDLNDKLIQYFIEMTKNGEMHTSSFVKVIWEYLYDRGYEDVLLDYYDLWLGASGLAWNEPVEEMLNLFDLFTVLIAKMDNDKILIRDARNLRRSHLLSFVEHKEDILNFPYQIFNKIHEEDPTQWRERGMDLMNLSEIVSQKGNNLLSNLITELIIKAAIISGPSMFYDLVNCDSFSETLIRNNRMISSLMMEKIDSGYEQLSVWFLLESIADKRTESDKRKIFDFISSIYENYDETTRLILETRLEEVSKTFGPDNDLPDRSILTNIDENSIKPLHTLIDKLEEYDFNDIESRSGLRKTFLEALDRLAMNRDQYFRKNFEILFSIFLNVEEGYTWESQGIQSAVSKLFLVMNDQQKKKLFEHMIHNRYFDGDVSFWLSSFSSNLNLYVLEFLYSINLELVLDFFDRQVQEIKSWDVCYQDTYKLMDISSHSEYSWVDVIENLIWIHFSTNQIGRTADAFRGLYFMYLVYPERWDNEFIITSTMVRQKYLLLLILEELTRSNVDITFADKFLEYCLNDSNQVTLRVASTIVRCYKNNDFSMLSRLYDGEINGNEGIVESNNVSDHLRHIAERLNISYTSDFQAMSIKYSEEYVGILSEIKIDETGMWRYCQTDENDYIGERYLNDELKGKEISIQDCLKIIPIDDPDVMIEFDKQIVFSERLFSPNFTDNSDVEYVKKIIQDELREDETIIGLCLAKMTDTGEELKFVSYALMPEHIRLDFDQVPIGKILGRGSLISDLHLYDEEYNYLDCLFDIVYGSTIYMSSYKLIPSELCKILTEKYDLNLDRKTFYVPNKDWYIHSKRNLNLSIEVWTAEKDALEELVKQNRMKLIEIVEEV